MAHARQSTALGDRKGIMKTGRLLLISAIALSLAACDKKSSGSAAPGTVAVTADDHGFTPSSVTFKKGAPAALVFTRTTDDTCATEVVFPELNNLKKDLPKNQPVTIQIPTDKEQKLTFQCGMGMYKSSIVVN